MLGREVKGDVRLIIMDAEGIENACDVVMLVGTGHKHGLVLVVGNIKLKKIWIHTDSGENGPLRESVKEAGKGGVHTAVGLEVVLGIILIHSCNAIAAHAEALLPRPHIRIVVLLKTEALFIDITKCTLRRCAFARIRRQCASVIHAVEELLHRKWLLSLKTAQKHTLHKGSISLNFMYIIVVTATAQLLAHLIDGSTLTYDGRNTLQSCGDGFTYISSFGGSK